MASRIWPRQAKRARWRARQDSNCLVPAQARRPMHQHFYQQAWQAPKFGYPQGALESRRVPTAAFKVLRQAHGVQFPRQGIGADPGLVDGCGRGFPVTLVPGESPLGPARSTKPKPSSGQGLRIDRHIAPISLLQSRGWPQMTAPSTSSLTIANGSSECGGNVTAPTYA